MSVVSSVCCYCGTGRRVLIEAEAGKIIAEGERGRRVCVGGGFSARPCAGFAGKHS